MSDFFERISKLSPQRLTLLAMDLQSKLETAEAAEAGRREPIAVIGMGCRFPGAENPEAYWQLLRDGVDMIRDIPADRWDSTAYFDPDPEAPGKIATRWGGFLEGIDRFDPQLFGITPREAISLDPQQRLLLEVAWEALENAGQAPDKLSGSPTGVFVGICNGDYGHRLLSGDDSNIDVYVSTGNAYSVASGRLSYVLGLQGPSLSVDTACSSSLVAIHLAIQSLRNRECRMALAGGVNVVLSPNTTAALSRARMMASDGRCKAFDAAADGFVRSEGCGLVVLKRLSDAVTNGDRIVALIRGSAVNQDGRSNGLTAPNGPSQVAVIRAALADAQLQPADVGYVETHGTGTSLGDPIEAQALGAALGQGRTTPLMIGSVKTNLGHLESAAGVAGLIKTVLVLQHAEIPPHLHFRQPSPYIPWDRLPLNVPTTLMPWPEPSARRITGVSSFGFSGTNAHILLENAPASQPQPAKSGPERPLQLLALSARDEAALRELANRYARHLAAHPETSLTDAAYTAGVGRAHLSHRLAVRGTDSVHVGHALATWVAGEAAEDVQAGKALGPREPEVTFLFTGHGAHYAGMGRGLYTAQPAFQTAIDRCAELLTPLMDRPLLEVLGYRGEPNDLLNHLVYSQPALFALQYALTQLWASWGVRPAAVAGHSAGEYAAAVTAGALSLEDGLKLIATRGRLMEALPPNGEMAAALADEERVRQLIAPYAEHVSIAAINGPNSVVISGIREAVQGAVATLRAAGVDVRSLNIPIAAHSSQVEPILDPLERAAASVTFAQPQVDFVSTVTGDLISMGEIGDSAYWRRHSRLPVRFADTAQRLYGQGRRVFVEIGPHSTLLGMLCHIVPEREVICAPSLRRDQDEWQVILRSLGALFVAGVPVDWAGIDRRAARQRLALPTYPFQRERYWIDPKPARARVVTPTERDTSLLGKQLRSPALSGLVFETEISLERLAFLDHHRIHGALLMPSPAYLEMALAAAREMFGSGAQAIEGFSISEPLILPEHGMRRVQTIVGAAQDGRAPVQIFSHDDIAGTWTLHVTAHIVAAHAASEQAADIATIQSRCPDEIDGETYYEKLQRLGLEFGSDFRGINRIWRRDGEAIASVVLPERLTRESSEYNIHPALLDACFHALGAPVPHRDEPASYLLIGIDRFQLRRPPAQHLWNHVVLRPGLDRGNQLFSGDITLYDDGGRLVAQAEGVHLKLATPDALRRAAGQHTSDWFYDVTWQPQPRDENDNVGGLASIADALRTTAQALGQQHGLSVYQAALPALDELALAYIARALRDLGWKPDDPRTAASLSITPRHARVFEHLLAKLTQAANHPSVIAPASAEALDARAAALGAQYPAIRAEVQLTRRCGAQLADVLRGTCDPLQLLFPDGSLAATESIYGDTPSSHVHNALVAEAARAFSAQAGDRPLRVLEIGAGSGATTTSVRSALPAGRSDYWFTDLSPLFLSRARERMSDDPSIHFALLDIARDPLSQGFTEGQFDMVIAANVVHATADLRQTLAHARQLLTPGGALVLLEGASPQLWVDVTFGLTEGWWKFADPDLRPSYPLLGSAKWGDLLKSLGYAHAATVIAEAAGQNEPSQLMVIAHAPVAVANANANADADADDWLIFGDADGLGEALAQQVCAGGATARLIARSASALTPQDLALVLSEARPSGYRRVVYLGGLDASASDGTFAEDDGTAQELACLNVLTLTRALSGSGQHTSLWLVTRGAQAAGNEAPRPSQAPLWGLGRVIALEHPDLWGGLIDLGGDGTMADEAHRLAVEIGHPTGEDQIALRGDVRFVARLIRRPAPAPRPIGWRTDGAYLITGGLGGLGLKVAHWMAQQGAKHIVLAGRTGLPDRAQWPSLAEASRTATQVAAIEAIEALGATVHTFAVDAGERAQVAALIDQFGADLPPLRGVIHAAADLSTWTIADMPSEAWHAMVRAKATAAWWLHELTRDLALDFFVLFSSTTGVWGSRAMAHYAAANHVLDILAHYRHINGLPALSIDWGTWDEMRIASAEERERVASFGLRPMPSDDALTILGNLLGNDELAQIVVADVDWERLRPAYEARRPLPLLSKMGAPAQARAAPTRTASVEQPAQAELLRRLERAQPAERAAEVLDHVRIAVARTLNLDTNRAIDIRQGLFEMGMDSLMSVELKGRLEVSVGRALPSTLTFNYPSIEALAGYLSSEVLGLTRVNVEAPLVAPAAADAANFNDDLSEDELAELLVAKLARLQ